jgi:hypothetical protein
MWHISGQMIARNLTLSMAGAVLLAGCDSNKIPELSIVSTSNGIPQVKITTSREKLESRAKEMLTKLQREFDLLASVKLPAIQTKGASYRKSFHRSTVTSKALVRMAWP